MTDIPERIPAPEAAGDRAPRIAVLIPCYNEAPTIAEVAAAFRAELPEAEICVFDNNSDDGTADRARQAGARVFHEKRQGKGFVVRSMFSKIDADVYLMVDGDATYPASAARALVEPILRGHADMVVATRLREESGSVFRPLHRFGNGFFLWIFTRLFHVRITDLLSGYRAFSRALVRGIPLFAEGFDIEAELTIKALLRGFSVVELPVTLRARPPGSRSKIRLFRDGFVILNAMLTLARDYKPLTIFGSAGAIFVLAGTVPAFPVVLESLAGGLVHPVLVAAAVLLFLLGASCVFTGLVLHAVARHFQELELRMRRDSEVGGPE